MPLFDGRNAATLRSSPRTARLLPSGRWRIRAGPACLPNSRAFRIHARPGSERRVGKVPCRFPATALPVRSRSRTACWGVGGARCASMCGVPCRKGAALRFRLQSRCAPRRRPRSPARGSLPANARRRRNTFRTAAGKRRNSSLLRRSFRSRCRPRRRRRPRRRGCPRAKNGCGCRMRVCGPNPFAGRSGTRLRWWTSRRCPPGRRTGLRA